RQRRQPRVLGGAPTGGALPDPRPGHRGHRRRRLPRCGPGRARLPRPSLREPGRSPRGSLHPAPPLGERRQRRRALGGRLRRRLPARYRRRSPEQRGHVPLAGHRLGSLQRAAPAARHRFLPGHRRRRRRRRGRSRRRRHGRGDMDRALAVILCVSVAATAQAGPRAKEHLKAGRALYDAQEYRKAIRELAPVKSDTEATRAQKLEALELLGLCFFILGEESSSREAFEDLLAIDPGYELREASGSPKIQVFFEKVKRAYIPNYRPQDRASIEHNAPAGAVAGRKVEFQADVTAGEEVVKEIVLYWRRQGVLAYQSAPLQLKGDTHWRVKFTPPADPAGYV